MMPDLLGVLSAYPPFGGAAAAAPAYPPPPVAPLRDRTILKLIAGLLDATGQFGRVTTSGPPEDAGQSAEHLKLAGLELGGFTEETGWNDFNAIPQTRTVQFLLWLHVRDPDPDVRDDELDRLSCVASNALNGVSVGGETFKGLTLFKGGRYDRATGAERRLRMLGQFAYLISDWTTRNTTP